MADRPSGLVDLEIDEYAVDPDVFAAFVETLVTTCLASHHTILKGMLAGYLPSALVMLERGGRVVAALQPPIKRSTEAIPLDIDASDPAADGQALVRAARAAERSMPPGRERQRRSSAAAPMTFEKPPR